MRLHTKEGNEMAEDEAKRITAQDEEQEIEAHAKRITATDEAADEGDDDFEAHARRTNVPRKN
jgi:hypothetical protein